MGLFLLIVLNRFVVLWLKDFREDILLVEIVDCVEKLILSVQELLALEHVNFLSSTQSHFLVFYCLDLPLLRLLNLLKLLRSPLRRFFHLFFFVFVGFLSLEPEPLGNDLGATFALLLLLVGFVLVDVVDVAGRDAN